MYIHYEWVCQMHTFAYARVSTLNQHNDNQLLEIERAGYIADAIYTDVVSGAVHAMDRPEFAKLVDAVGRTRKPKRLVVTRLDRLGRNAVDVMSTVQRFAALECQVRVIQLGDIDLTSGAGKIILATLSAVAEIERDTLVERTQAGLARAKAQGKRLGRPRTESWEHSEAIHAALLNGETVSQVSRLHGVSRATVLRIRNASVVNL
jgi:putative DNA-invertase from lambdoid prophage Rac